MDLDGSHLIVVAVIEGKNFECPGDHDSAQSEKRKYVSYMEARFNGEVLVSDAIELRSSEPQYNTELAWELDRKSLHLFRIERTPIKLQCFIEDTERQVKRFVGYLVLDLRTAQDEKNTKFAWKPLLNSKYRGPSHMRPELLCSLQLLKGDNGNTQKALLSPPKNYISSLENATANMFENDLRVKVSNGYHKIWDSKKSSEDDCKLIYSLNVVFNTAKYLYKLLSTPENPKSSYHLLYSLFGNSLKTSAFTDLHMAPINEKNSLKIAVSDEKVLATYFALNPTLEIQFCENSGKAHGTVTVSLNSFAVTNQQPKSVSGEFKFLPTDDTIVINEPVTVIDMSVKVQRLLSEELPQTPRISANNRKGISVGQQEIHHICLSLDIRKLNVSLTSCLPLRDVFVQYSYANLGYTKKIKTEAIEIIRDVSEFKVFKDGYFAFNFASTLDRLSNTMSEPLIFELVQKTKDKNMLIAIGHLKLDEVLQASKPDQNENVKCVKVQLLDTSDSELGQLDVIACLNDVGPANGDMHFSSLSQPTFLNSTDQSTSDPAMKELENLLIEAAVEVEIWKQKKMNNFLDDLRRKEEHYLKSLAEDNDKVLENRKKVLDEREANLSNMLKKLEVKEDVLAHKEKVLDEKEKILMLRLETLDREITIAIEDVKKSMDAKLKVEQEKNVALEDNLKKISDRNPLSTVRETSRSMRSPSNSESANIRARSCLGRANSVPNSVRSASKQRNGTLPASETPPPRRSESIARTQNNSVPAARLRTQPSKPAVITKVINTNGTSNGIWSTARSTVTRNTLMDRKNILLTKLQQEKSELLATKVVPPDDIMIKTIDAELRKHGVYKRK